MIRVVMEAEKGLLSADAKQFDTEVPTHEEMHVPAIVRGISGNDRRAPMAELRECQLIKENE